MSDNQSPRIEKRKASIGFLLFTLLWIFFAMQDARIGDFGSVVLECLMASIGNALFVVAYFMEEPVDVG